jgi:hypothetical protein
VPARTHRKVRKTVPARRDTTWTKVAVVLNVVAATMSLSTATLHALPTSPPPAVINVIYAPPRLGCDMPEGG